MDSERIDELNDEHNRKVKAEDDFLADFKKQNRAVLVDQYAQEHEDDFEEFVKRKFKEWGY